MDRIASYLETGHYYQAAETGALPYQMSRKPDEKPLLRVWTSCMILLAAASEAIQR